MSRKRKPKFNKPEFELAHDTKKDIWAIIIFLIALLSILSMFNLAGDFGRLIDIFWQMIFGLAWWIWPFALVGIGFMVINREKLEIKTGRWVGLFLFLLSLVGIFHLFADDKSFDSVRDGVGGGILGYLIGFPLENLASFWGALIILLALICISFLIFFETSINSILDNFHLPAIHIFTNLKNKFRRDKNNIDDEDVGFEQRQIDEIEFEENEDENNELNEDLINDKKSTPKKVYTHIDIPLDLLNGKSSKPTAGDIKHNQQIIQDTLKHFKIDVEMADVSVGPTVTQYAFKPASGVKVSQITTLNNDLALALAAHPLRIEAPIPGKSLIGIEVPNEKVALVTLKEMLAGDKFKKRESNLMMALGKDVAGEIQFANLDKMPHLLVAGATNSGKTVCLNTIIVSMLFQNQPDDLKFIMVDPKQVEMVQYNNIPHLLCPVITDVKKTINALRWAVREMEERFKTLSSAGKRNIQAYNASRPKETMPYLVIIIDELADLMSTAGPEIEQAVVRLAQKARAVGIHLIIATQRPSVNVITGLIKANITARIAFSVASSADSRTILDCSGAEKLLGRGDMLLITAEFSKPKRIQGAFLSDDEIHRVVDYLKSHGEPNYLEEITESQTSSGFSGGSNNLFDDEDGDEFLEEAQELVIKAGKASASYLQRRLRIGYSRAARILDLLEEKGIVGPAEGSKPREVLISHSSDLDYQDNDTLEQLHEQKIAEESEEEFDDEDNDE